MAEEKSGKFWVAAAAVCAAVIISGVITGLVKYEPGEPVVIHQPQPEDWQGTIYIGGDVNLPGYYPFGYDDDISSLIKAAGGTLTGAEPDNIVLRIPGDDENRDSQKIDINRAEAWLLEALPGIGETLAQRIVDYRRENGVFVNITGLLQVEGIGPATLEKIEGLITVSE